LPFVLSVVMANTFSRGRGMRTAAEVEMFVTELDATTKPADLGS
jgi:hypothetical protein